LRAELKRSQLETTRLEKEEEKEEGEEIFIKRKDKRNKTIINIQKRRSSCPAASHRPGSNGKAFFLLSKKKLRGETHKRRAPERAPRAEE
jgi:hypothetical protein